MIRQHYFGNEKQYSAFVVCVRVASVCVCAGMSERAYVTNNINIGKTNIREP